MIQGSGVRIASEPGGRREIGRITHCIRNSNFVDIALELNRYGRLRSDARRRQIVSLSRKLSTPERLIYEWDPTTGLFTGLTDPFKRQFEQNWA